MSQIDSNEQPETIDLRLVNILEILCRVQNARRSGDEPALIAAIDEINGTDLAQLILMVRNAEPSEPTGEATVREPAANPPPPDGRTTATRPTGESPTPSEIPKEVGKSSHRNRDRGLLIGLLGLQNGFVDHLQLVAALRAWAKSADKSFAQLLIERRVIDDGRLSLLELLASEHVRQHGDPEASIAAIGPLGISRDLIQEALVPDAIDHQAFVATEIRDQGTDSDTKTFIPRAEASWSNDSSRYRILRKYAHGNLGEIYVALDLELNREVALKQIRPDRANDTENRERFVLEAEITANLEHPNIVPVHGMNRHSDGRPFYAMRLVKGETLALAVSRFHADGGHRQTQTQRLAFRKLLRSFVAVCEAIAYTHFRGVIHRDIKPANILLGPYGETFMVDFGLAKPVGRSEQFQAPGEETLKLSSGSGSNVSLVASIRGTPAYMAPEQADFQTAGTVGPACDIYGLGATLYYILTNKAPFRDLPTVEAILAQVRRGAFPPPKRTDSRIPAALEAICLKAMALQPEDRYSTALELASDIERWMADEPVSAYADPILTRMARWTRKHQTLAAGVGILAMAGLIFLAIYDYKVGIERRRAESNFETARNSVSSLFTDIAEARIPGGISPPARLWFADRAIRYVDELLRQNPSDRRLQAESARIHREVGNIQRSLGYPNESKQSYQKAKTQLEAIGSRELPGLPRVELALLLTDEGVILRDMDDADAAINRFQEAIALLDLENARTSGDRSLLRALAYPLIQLGTIPQPKQTTEKSRESLDLALSILTEMTQSVAPPPDPQDGMLLCSAQIERARLRIRQQDLGGAESDLLNASKSAIAFIQMIKDGTILCRVDPNTFISELRSLRAEATRERMSLIARDPKRLTEAEATMAKVIADLELLVAQHPLPDYKLDLIRCLETRGQLRLRLGQTAEAKVDLTTALEQAKKLNGVKKHEQLLRKLTERLESSLKTSAQ